MKVLSIVLFLFLFECFTCSTSVSNVLPRPLLPGMTYNCCKHEPYASHKHLPAIYCYHGSQKLVTNIWQTISVLIDLNPDMYDLYEGSDVTEVLSLFEAHRSAWSFNFKTFRRKHIQLNPFNKTCIGIQTDYDYTIHLQVKDVDYFQVALFISGVVIFFLSPTLSNNPLFYYLTGISIGMLASILILLYFVIKLLPLKRPAVLGVIAGGSTLAVYLIQTFYENILLLLFMYHEYVICYLVGSALISFVVCYRWGPVSNPRSINLIKWSLQVFALVLIFLSSYLPEFGLSADVILLSVYNIPLLGWIGSFLRMSNLVVFPVKSRFKHLSVEEYKEQGEIETARGLEDLRNYCNSPKCRQWQTVLRLQDPHRFAKFMSGKSHVTEEEEKLYEEDGIRMSSELLTDDSDED